MGTRGRQLSSDEDELSAPSEHTKRVTTQAGSQLSTGHYVSPGSMLGQDTPDLT